MHTLPIVDLHDTANAPRILYEACRDYGFFYLINHDISPALISEVLTQTKAFFSLPLEEKEGVSVKNNSINRGYTAMEEEVLDPGKQTRGDTKEGYYIGREVAADSDEATKFPLHGPNQWPSPFLLPQWRETMEEYFAAMQALGLRTVRVLMCALSLPENHLDEKFMRPMAALRLLHYAPQPSCPEAGIFGAGAHSDYGMFTFLLLEKEEKPALEVLLNEQWVCVPYLPGAYVVNLGDMLSRWTNDVFKSTVHRVVVRGGGGEKDRHRERERESDTENGEGNGGGGGGGEDTNKPTPTPAPTPQPQESHTHTPSHTQDRYSIPFFYEPAFDSLVECLPAFVSEERPAKYAPIRSGDYLLQKYTQTHKDFEGGGGGER